MTTSRWGATFQPRDRGGGAFFKFDDHDWIVTTSDKTGRRLRYEYRCAPSHFGAVVAAVHHPTLGISVDVVVGASLALRRLLSPRDRRRIRDARSTSRLPWRSGRPSGHRSFVLLTPVDLLLRNEEEFLNRLRLNHEGSRRTQCHEIRPADDDSSVELVTRRSTTTRRTQDFQNSEVRLTHSLRCPTKTEREKR